MQKLIDTDIRTRIHDFTTLIQRTKVYMNKFKDEIKALATARDKYDKNLSTHRLI